MTLKKQTFSGIKWTAASTITLAVINILKISILTRFLAKGDFGLMALVTFVLGFMNLFMDMGLSSAILHKQDISKQEYASLYWMNIFFSLFLFLLIFLISPFIATFYNEGELKTLIPIMSLSIIISALGRQFKTVEQKALNFRYLAVVDILGDVTGLIVSIILAINEFGVYSLVYGTLTKFATSNLIYFCKGIVSHGMLFYFNYSKTKPYINIGIYQVGGQVVNYFNRDLDVLIIGKFFGTDVLGGYSLAKELVRRPMGIINPIITKVGMSVFPKFQKDQPALQGLFLKLFNGMGAINALAYGSIAIFANFIVLLLYGQNFLSIVIFVQLFTLVTFLRSMGSNVSILVITTGRTDSEFYWNIITTIIMPLAVVLGAMHSIHLIIINLGLVQLALLIPSWYIFYKRLINLKLYPFIKSNIIPMFIALIVVLISQLFFHGNIYWQILSWLILLVSIMYYSYLTLSEFKLYVNSFLVRIFPKGDRINSFKK